MFGVISTIVERSFKLAIVSNVQRFIRSLRIGRKDDYVWRHLDRSGETF